MAAKERVIHIASPDDPAQFIPRIAQEGEGGAVRSFRTDDIGRVRDFERMPPPPSACPMLHSEGAGPEAAFPRRQLTVRGAYLFYFDEEDVDPDTGGFEGPPLGVIPLDRCLVEFPPGGRRVFREHAATPAKNGYELMVRHRGDAPPPGGEGGEDEDVLAGFRRGGAGASAKAAGRRNVRAPHYLVASSLGQREEWAAAIRVRAEVSAGRVTVLRPDRGGGGTRPPPPPPRAPARGGRSNPFDDGPDGEGGGRGGPATRPGGPSERGKRRPKSSSRGGRPREAGGPRIDAASLGVAPEEHADVNSALRKFGMTRFDEAEWVDEFFRSHNEFDAPGMVRTLEKWQGSMKKGMKGAVLEQYEYFVEANREMTTMGKEVGALRALVDVQMETIQTMRTIDFAAAFADPVPDDYSYYSDEDLMGMDDLSVGGSSVASLSTTGLGGSEAARSRRRGQGGQAGYGHGETDEEEGDLMEVPEWLDDVTEEVSAFLKECRYTDATELIGRARAEINDLLSQHERLTEKRLGRKQLAAMQQTLGDLEDLSKKLGNRLAEGLRRKNEALKQTIKRERADPLSAMAPIASPICLNDDAVALQLLVKLGRSTDAATAYAARRSLLLMECLHERAIASASEEGAMDVVIYSAQLSQSFFSCLSQSVEGFLDLFMKDGSGGSAGGKPDNNEKLDDMSSLHSGSGTAGRKVPSSAIASVVLWCDSELSKFAAAFGGTRVLGKLALAPKKSTDGKQREAAIDIAAKCVDQAFQFSSENLDSIGLPMTPRLSEYIRARLKGCEGEMAKQLQGKWASVVFDWNENGIGLAE